MKTQHSTDMIYLIAKIYITEISDLNPLFKQFNISKKDNFANAAEITEQIVTEYLIDEKGVL